MNVCFSGNFRRDRMIYGHGGDIYTYQGMMDFSVNVNPLGPPQRVIEAAKRGAELAAAYPDSRCGRLREKLSQRQGIPGECYIFGNGAAELLYNLVLAEKPGRALIPVPAFSEYEQALRTVGCEIKYYQTKQDNGYCIDSNFLSELNEEIDLVFLCSPTNPSGRAADRYLLCQAAERCERFGIRMVLDECFMEFLQRPEAHSMIRETGDHRQLFTMRAFTKTYAMPGLRLGYGISSDHELLERMNRARQPWNVSIPAQEAGIAALDESEYVKTARKLIAEERLYLEKVLEELGIKYISSDVNFILIHTEKALFEEMKKYGILIRDCGNYRGLEKGWYRIAVRTHEANMRLVNALEDICRTESTQYKQSEEKTG